MGRAPGEGAPSSAALVGPRVGGKVQSTCDSFWGGGGEPRPQPSCGRAAWREGSLEEELEAGPVLGGCGVPWGWGGTGRGRGWQVL